MRVTNTQAISTSITKPTSSPVQLRTWAAALPHHGVLNPRGLAFDVVVHRFSKLPHGKIYPEECAAFRVSLEKGCLFPHNGGDPIPVQTDGTFHHPKLGRGRFTSNGTLELGGQVYTFERRFDRVTDRVGPYARPIRWERFRYLTYGGFPPRTESQFCYTD